MKIAVFYRDAFQTGGVPHEINQLIQSLVGAHQVTVWGKRGSSSAEFNSVVECFQYNNITDLAVNFYAWSKKNEVSLLLIVGLFLYENALAALIAKLNKITIVLNPLAQATDAILKGKIFTKNPDIRDLERGKRQALKIKQKLLDWSSILLKQVYLKTLGQFIVKNSAITATFSNFESRQFKKHFPRFNGTFSTLRWGIDQPVIEKSQGHYYQDILGYQDNKSNYVYWGRLDWYYKGIDRLLNGVLYCLQNNKQSELPFRLFLIGPDYNNGVSQIQQFIKKHQLEEVVHLMLPGSYPSGSKHPLRDASASIYLSRWDGFPRTLRESMSLGVPALVSHETHFGDLVLASASGTVVENPDNPEEVSKALLNLQKMPQAPQAAKQLSTELTWDSIAQKFLLDCEPALQASNLTRQASL